MRHALAALILVAAIAAIPGGALADATAPSPPAQARINAAAEAYKLAEARYRVGVALPGSVYLWSVRWYGASRDAGVTAAAAEHLKRMQSLESDVKGKVAAGLLSAADGAGALYYRVEAELWAGAKGR